MQCPLTLTKCAMQRPQMNKIVTLIEGKWTIWQTNQCRHRITTPWWEMFIDPQNTCALPGRLTLPPCQAHENITKRLFVPYDPPHTLIMAVITKIEVCGPAKTLIVQHKSSPPCITHFNRLNHVLPWPHVIIVGWDPNPPPPPRTRPACAVQRKNWYF